MLFKEILDSKTAILSQSFDKLFDDIVHGDSHHGDLLLINALANYREDILNWNVPGHKFQPFVLGQGSEERSELTHYRFIHNYRTKNMVNTSKDEYLTKFGQAMQTEEDILKEEINIQTEMLIYLKIWESDLFIAKYYQIARIANNEPYDWYFKIKSHNREENTTGTREQIIRNKIRDSFKTSYPSIYNAFKTAYITQLRNSIAHSKYAFIGQNINLNNYGKNDPASQLHSIEISQWLDIFHESMILYNELIKFEKKIIEHYQKVALLNDNLIEVKISGKSATEPDSFAVLKYDTARKRWDWRRT